MRPVEPLYPFWRTSLVERSAGSRRRRAPLDCGAPVHRSWVDRAARQRRSGECTPCIAARRGRAWVAGGRRGGLGVVRFPPAIGCAIERCACSLCVRGRVLARVKSQATTNSILGQARLSTGNRSLHIGMYGHAPCDAPRAHWRRSWTREPIAALERHATGHAQGAAGHRCASSAPAGRRRLRARRSCAVSEVAGGSEIGGLRDGAISPSKEGSVHGTAATLARELSGEGAAKAGRTDQ